MIKTFFYNIDYFLKETKTLFRVDLLSNIFSIISISFIFLILAMMTSGWNLSNQVIDALQKEAEVSVYFAEHLSTKESTLLREKIEKIDGVRESRIVKEEESYARMEEILGKEARVLRFFDENPFRPFIEVKIDMIKIDQVLKQLDNILGIVSIRDNRQVLERLKEVVSIVIFIGILVMAAVGISTFIVISHIIRQGIYNNREQISTLKLLGAPDSFIGFPFILEGLILTICGGTLAIALSYGAIQYIYGQITGTLPFVPLVEKEALFVQLSLFIMTLSIALGIAGSLFGLSSAKSK